MSSCILKRKKNYSSPRRLMPWLRLWPSYSKVSTSLSQRATAYGSSVTYCMRAKHFAPISSAPKAHSYSYSKMCNKSSSMEIGSLRELSFGYYLMLC